ncbi:MAG: DotI/IcmL/TraM family protein [Pseudomonadota bacterium]|nr:DotI/IcmL/TraM family protein [Pseudomonadota bacterium]
MRNDVGYQAVLNRRQFYRDRSRTITLVVLISFVTNLILAIACLIFIFYPPPAEFILTYPDGRLMKVQPLTEAVKSTPQIRAFAADAAAAVFSYDFVNYRSQLQQAANFFTYSGWASYKNKLEASKNVQYVVDNRLVTTAAPVGVPVIINQSEINGRYTWQVTVPILRKFSGPTVSQNESKKITMLIQRAPYSECPNGIGIVQLLEQ